MVLYDCKNEMDCLIILPLSVFGVILRVLLLIIFNRIVNCVNFLLALTLRYGVRVGIAERIHVGMGDY